MDLTIIDIIAAALSGLFIVLTLLSLLLASDVKESKRSKLEKYLIRIDPDKLIRIAVISLAASIAFASKSAWVSFAAVFIIGTAITTLDFLHTLAAIIRGDGHYFKYKQENLSAEQVIENHEVNIITNTSDGIEVQVNGEIDEAVNDVADNAVEPEVVTKEATLDVDAAKDWEIQSSIGEPSNQRTKYYVVEQLALEWMQKKFRRSIDKFVRFTSPICKVDVDGYIKSFRGGEDILIEVKWWSKIEDTRTRLTNHMIDVQVLSDSFKEITDRRHQIHLVVVTSRENKISNEFVEWFNSKMKRAAYTATLYAVTEDEIGYMT